ncbi:MAG: AAA family ATPase [Kiritimatiellae bacterium]|nr:AAA family ATPase [Kiritimatiellia bacterium]
MNVNEISPRVDGANHLDWDSPIGPHGAKRPTLATPALKPRPTTFAAVNAAELAQRLNARKNGNGWTAKCPAHDDTNPSLSISEGRDGRILLHCHAGCTTETIVAAMGLCMADLMPETTNTPQPAPAKLSRTFTSAEEAAKICTPKDGTLEAVYLYPRKGQPFGATARYRTQDDKTFRQFHVAASGWSPGAPDGKWPPYGVDALPPKGLIYVVEGEKCQQAAAGIGLAAVTSAGGSKAAAKSDWTAFSGREVVILPDHDTPGEAYATEVACLMGALNLPARVCIVRLPGLPDGGDIVDFLEARDAAEPTTIRAEIETLAAQVQAKPPTGALIGIDARLWIETEPPQPDQIFCDAFDAGDKVSVIGSSKMRKSFLVLQAALCMAAGRDFLTWKVMKPRRVLLAQFEITTKHFHRRVRNMARAMGISAEDIGDRLLIFNCRGITGETAIEQIGEEARKYHAEVIVFDPLYKLTSGDENAAKDMKPTLAAFDRLAEATGAAVIYVHHDAKGHAGDRDSRDRGAGSNVGRRDDDFTITITAHDTEESSVVIDCLWRNYKPRDQFTATWTERGCFEYMPDMPAVKKTSRSKSATTTARPEIETYIDAAMNLIVQKPLAISLFREKIEAMAGMNRERQRCLIEILLADGKLSEYCIRGKGLNKAWIGTPKQIEEMRQTKMNV